MEDILGVQMRPPISLRQFLAEYKTVLPNHQTSMNEDDIHREIKLDVSRAIANEAACSPDLLDQSDDVHIVNFIPGVSEMNRKINTQNQADLPKLRSFNYMLQSKETSARNPFQRSQEIFKLVKCPARSDNDELCHFYNDIIVTVRVYRPARATHIGRSIEKPVFAEEFECLGSNLLTDLRDKISCVSNKNHFFDISENPTTELPIKDKDPGFFFITDTFYNDKRNPDNLDYSATIRNWAKKATGLTHLKFNVAKMEDIRFIDLTVSLGFPQLYQHHGNCEHVFTFSQVEVITPASQCISVSQFPRMRSFCLFNNRLCNMCGKQHYVFIVEKSTRQLQDPAYLCSKCFESFHYLNGKKIGRFKAYRVNNYAIEDNSVPETEFDVESDNEVDAILPIKEENK